MGLAQSVVRLLKLLEIRLLTGSVAPKRGGLPPVANLPGQGDEKRQQDQGEDDTQEAILKQRPKKLFLGRRSVVRRGIRSQPRVLVCDAIEVDGRLFGPQIFGVTVGVADVVAGGMAGLAVSPRW